jgi:serine/threonine-protein kinase
MGVVFAARHVLTHQRVALKFLLLHPAHAEEQTQRFLNEARAAVQIQSEHVGRVVDFGTLASGAPYMVMELLDGQDLGALVASRGPLPVDDAVGYVLQACEALAEAHALGIVHRDLKPANLFLSFRRDGSPLVKVLDFGISRLNVDDDPNVPRLTQTRGALGSPLYMSPEQLLTPKDVDARSDLWSLGVVLYELLSASCPFHAETHEGLVVQIVTQAASPIDRFRSGLPPALLGVIARCLNKDRTARFGSIGELAAALGPFASADAQISVARASCELVAGRVSSSSVVPAWTPSPPLSPALAAGAVGTDRATQHGWDTPGPAGRPTSSAGPWVVAGALVAVVGLVLAFVSHRVASPRRDSALAAPALVVSTASSATPVLTPATAASLGSVLGPTVAGSAATPAVASVAKTAASARWAGTLPSHAATARHKNPTDFGGK